jgi:hypothetical protein
MKIFLLLGLVAAASCSPQSRLRSGRQGAPGGSYLAPAAEASSLYGAPAEDLETNYGAPEEPEAAASELDSSYLSPAASSDYAAEEPLETYEESEDYYEDEGQAGYEGELDSAGSELDDVAADPLKMLMNAVPGVPGEDYPIFAEAPETAFSCDGQLDGGYYADEEALCQVFHICTNDGNGGLNKYSFLCPNGTIFNQNYFICDWWFNFDCSEAAALAESKNAEIAAERSAVDELAAAGSETVEDVQGSYGAPSEDYADEADAGYGAPAEYEARRRF